MAESAVTKKLGANPTRKEILANWTPEDPVFWKKFGERIAKQNLYTSTWALVLAFVVWTLWATIAAKLNMAGFHFSDEQLFTLAALPGLVGATGRLFYTYLPGLIGGRNSAFITTALLLFPLFGLGRALQDPTTSYDTFVLLVSFIGIAGANFSASMANIGFFFPKAHKGLALGINAGIGKLLPLLPLKIVRRIDVLRTPMSDGHHEIRNLARLDHIARYIARSEHLDAPRRICGQRDSIGLLCIVKQGNLYAVALHNGYLPCVFLVFEYSCNDHLGMVVLPKLNFRFNAVESLVHGMIGGARPHVNARLCLGISYLLRRIKCRVPRCLRQIGGSENRLLIDHRDISVFEIIRHMRKQVVVVNRTIGQLAALDERRMGKHVAHHHQRDARALDFIGNRSKVRALFFGL